MLLLLELTILFLGFSSFVFYYVCYVASKSDSIHAVDCIQPPLKPLVSITLANQHPDLYIDKHLHSITLLKWLFLELQSNFLCNDFLDFKDSNDDDDDVDDDDETLLIIEPSFFSPSLSLSLYSEIRWHSKYILDILYFLHFGSLWNNSIYFKWNLNWFLFITISFLVHIFRI